MSIKETLKKVIAKIVAMAKEEFLWEPAEVEWDPEKNRTSEMIEEMGDAVTEWFQAEANKNSLIVDGRASTFIESFLMNALSSRVIEPWRVLLSLHPETSDLSMGSFIENPANHLINELGYSVVKCPNVSDFPMKGVSQKLYLSTNTGIYYVWLEEAKTYQKLYSSGGG